MTNYITTLRQYLQSAWCKLRIHEKDLSRIVDDAQVILYDSRNPEELGNTLADLIEEGEGGRG